MFLGCTIGSLQLYEGVNVLFCGDCTLLKQVIWCAVSLPGKKDVVRVLLEHGACTGIENSIHRTATQMAAFVG